jgi:ferritin-like metal-binding protein YciE
VDCPGIDGLISEADEVAGEVDDNKALNTEAAMAKSFLVR